MFFMSIGVGLDRFGADWTQFWVREDPIALIEQSKDAPGRVSHHKRTIIMCAGDLAIKPRHAPPTEPPQSLLWTQIVTGSMSILR